MRTKLVKGTGIQGILMQLSICDMFAAANIANTLNNVINREHEIADYKTTPYDQRKEKFPNGQPEKIEIPVTDLIKLRKLLEKMSYQAHSTLFEENDEEWPGADNDIDE